MVRGALGQDRAAPPSWAGRAVTQTPTPTLQRVADTGLDTLLIGTQKELGFCVGGL